MSTFTTNEISQLMSALGKGEVNAIHAADLAAVLDILRDQIKKIGGS